MKSFVRNAGLNAASLFVSSQVPVGIRISGGIFTFIEAGFVFSLITLLLRPLLQLITLPFHFLSLGLITFFINAALLYVLTLLIPFVSVHPFIFPGAHISGFVIPKISFNLFFSYIISAFILSLILSFFNWIIK